MAKRDILKEAIADAKAVKEVAIANAKAALEEAFTPQLKSMLAAKIQEMDEEDSMEEMLDMNTDMRKDDKEEKKTEDEKYGKDLAENEYVDEEINLDEILAELEEETLNEAEEVETEEEVEVEDEDDTEEEVETETEEEGVDIEDMTDEDLKSFIEDVIGDMVASGELEAGEGFETEGEVEVEDDEEIDIEVEDDETEEVEIAERVSRTNRYVTENFNQRKPANTKAIAENQKLRRELKEAHAAIKTQRSTLNEVKLLNAKLLYTNKIFKAKSLTENEKVKVLSSFDKATTIKETKLIFETLSEGLKSKRTPIRESLGSASKATGNFKRTKNPIIKTDPMVERFQKLAGLK